MKTYHLIGAAPYFTNCFVITDNTGNAVLIDASGDVDKIDKILKNDKAQLKAILLTHGHDDHRETLQRTVEMYHCPVYVGQEDAKLFGLSHTHHYTDGEHLTFGEISCMPSAHGTHPRQLLFYLRGYVVFRRYSFCRHRRQNRLGGRRLGTA